MKKVLEYLFNIVLILLAAGMMTGVLVCIPLIVVVFCDIFNIQIAATELLFKFEVVAYIFCVIFLLYYFFTKKNTND